MMKTRDLIELDPVKDEKKMANLIKHCQEKFALISSHLEKLNSEKNKKPASSVYDINDVLSNQIQKETNLIMRRYCMNKLKGTAINFIYKVIIRDVHFFLKPEFPDLP